MIRGESFPFQRATAVVAGAAAALACSACSTPLETTETHCYVQRITASDGVFEKAIERGLQTANHGESIDLQRTTGAQDASRAIKATMGLVMKRDEPQNHPPMDSSIFGWCTTDVKQGSSVQNKYIDPLYITPAAFNVKEATARYEGNSDLQAMIAKIAPAGNTAVVFPSDAKSPLKLPKQLRKSLPEPNSVAEVIGISAQAVTVGDLPHTIFSADLKTARFEPVR